jgi:preprotein translocase subunit YajC
MPGIELTLVLAQDNAADTPPPPPSAAEDAVETVPGAAGDQPIAPGGAAQPGPDLFSLMLPLIIIFGIVIIFSSFSRKREVKRRDEMLSKIAKGSRVRTAGGILGTVVEVRDDEVLVKVDESANTRIRFARDAITAVMEEKE